MKRPVFIILLILIVLIISVSIFCLVNYFIQNAENNKQEQIDEDLYDKVFHIKETVEPENTESAVIDESVDAEESDTTWAYESYDYSALREINPDCIGWVSLPGTGIEKPIMWKKGDNSEYIHKNAYGEYAYLGAPFMDGFCDPLNGDLIIYGHNTYDRTGFGALSNYVYSPNYVDSRPYIDLYLYENAYRFEIVGVCKVSAQKDKDFYEYYSLVEPQAKTDFLNRMLSKSLIKKPSAPITNTDRFVMLSTCEYSQANGRLVIFGRLIEQI